jgi:phospholipase C
VEGRSVCDPFRPVPERGTHVNVAKKPRRGSAVVAVMVAVAAVALGALGPLSTPDAGAAPTGIHKIKHVIIIMQENRSFDEYFGTFPGADGIPKKNCNPDPANGGCVKSYVTHSDVENDLPHSAKADERSRNHGKMNGFVASAETGFYGNNGRRAMARHTASDIPNYWSYAKDYVLHDRMFAPARSWSLPEHLFMVSAWSAKCANHKAMSCVSDINGPSPVPPLIGNPLKVKVDENSPIYAWTDITYLLHKFGVSWAYYVVAGAEPDCNTGPEISCAPRPLRYQTLGYWNPLPYFDTVRKNKQVKNIKDVTSYYAAAKSGNLPAVSWITPSQDVSEHPAAAISSGQSYVTSLINAAMRGPDWNSTAIFVAWDDWGGFYDHVRPPKIDINGYGLRVPSFIVSPYARKGVVDHQTLTFDAYLRFVEDDFLSGRRLDPKTDGRPDRRPTVRENVPTLGDLTKDFDFTQKPRPPKLLPLHPKTTLKSVPPFAPVIDSATPGVGEVKLVWDVPTSDGGAKILHYLVTPYRNGVAQPAHTYPYNDPYIYTDVITGLTSGAKYQFTVQAVSKLGEGKPGRSLVVTVG